MILKLIYVTTTNENELNAETWKWMADHFKNEWMNHEFFLVQTEDELRSASLPKPEEAVLELILEESPDHDDCNCLVLRDERADYVLEIKKETPPAICSMLCISLLAAARNQLDEFELTEKGFCLDDMVVVNLAGTEFDQYLRGRSRDEHLNLLGELTASRTQIVEQDLIPAYEAVKQQLLNGKPVKDRDTAVQIAEAVFENSQNTLARLNEIETELQDLAIRTTMQQARINKKLRAWNLLFHTVMKRVMQGDEEAEKFVALLFEPRLTGLNEQLKEDYQLVVTDSNSPDIMKKQLQFLLSLRLSNEQHEMYEKFIRDKIFGKDLSFLRDDDETLKRRLYLALIDEAILETLENREFALEYRKTDLDSAQMHTALEALLQDLPEDPEEAILQVMSGLGLSYVLASTAYGYPMSPEVVAPASRMGIRLFLEAMENRKIDLDEHLVLIATALSALLMYEDEHLSWREQAIDYTDRLFLELTASSRLEKPLSPTELTALSWLCFHFFRSLNLENGNEQSAAFNNMLSLEEIRERQVITLPVLNWIEKYASIHGLQGLASPYEDLWFFSHEQTASREERQTFLSLLNRWAVSNPADATDLMTRSLIRLAWMPEPIYSFEGEPDLIFQIALQQMLEIAELDGTSMYWQGKKLTEFYPFFGSIGLACVPTLGYEKMIRLFDKADPEEVDIRFPEDAGPGGNLTLRDLELDELEADLQNSLFLDYSTHRLHEALAALQTTRELTQSNKSKAPGMAVQAARLFNWFMKPNNFAQLSIEDQGHAAQIGYDLGELFMEFRQLDLAVDYLGWTRDVLDHLDEEQELSDLQKEILLECRYNLLLIAMELKDTTQSNQEASRLLELLSMDKEDASQRNLRENYLYVFCLYAMKTGFFGSGGLLHLEQNMLPLLAGDEISKDRTKTGTPELHEAILDLYEEILEEACKQKDYPMMGNLAMRVMDQTLINSDLHERNSRSLAMKLFLASKAQSGKAAEARANAQSVARLIQLENSGNGYFTEPANHMAAVLLADLDGKPDSASQKFLSQYLIQVNFFALLEKDILDLVHDTDWDSRFPDAAWSSLESRLLERDLTRQESAVPRPFWQTDLLLQKPGLSKLTRMSSFEELEEMGNQAAEILEGLNRLEENRSVSFAKTRARLHALDNLRGIVRDFTDPQIFNKIDEARKELLEEGIGNSLLFWELDFQLLMVQAMAGFMVSNAEKLQEARVQAGKILETVLKGRVSPESQTAVLMQELDLVILLMDAQLAAEEKRMGDMAKDMKEAETLFGRLQSLHTHEDLVILDALLEGIRLQVSESGQKNTRRSLRLIEDLQRSLRDVLLTGSLSLDQQ